MALSQKAFDEIKNLLSENTKKEDFISLYNIGNNIFENDITLNIILKSYFFKKEDSDKILKKINSSSIQMHLICKPMELICSIEDNLIGKFECISIAGPNYNGYVQSTCYFSK